jgi:hypothetical protein
MSRQHAIMRAMTQSDKIDRDVLFARLLVIVATVAVFLAVSVPWYVPDGETPVPASGWSLLAYLAGDSVGLSSFAGYFGWVVVLAALVAGAGVPRLVRLWVCGLLSTALALLAGGLLLVNLRFEKDLAGVQLAGAWAALPVLLFAAVAWGNLAAPLRELSYRQ